MPQNSEVCSLNVIYDIFKQVSVDSLGDCKKAIEEIMRHVMANESNVNDDRNVSTVSSFIKEIPSIKMMLKLYELSYFNSSENKTTPRLSFDLIIQNIQNLLSDESSNYNLLTHQLEEDLLEIISLVFKIASMQGSQDDLDEITTFFQNIIAIFNIYNVSNSSDKSFMLTLRILCVVYSAFSNISESKSAQKHMSYFNKKICTLTAKHKDNISKYFAKIILYSAECAAIQTLLFVIPEYVKSVKTNDIIFKIWGEISISMKDSTTDLKSARRLTVLCYLFNLCFEESILENENNLHSLFFDDANYWCLIQSGLTERDPIIKKQAMYLFKKTINLFSEMKASDSSIENKSNYSALSEKHVCKWQANFNNEFHSIYTEIIVILEFLDEQQVHLIKPIFLTIEKLTQKILHLPRSGTSIDFSWIILIYQKALMHESVQVVKWGLHNLLKLPVEVFSDELVSKKVISILVPILNNMTLYYNDGMTVSNELTIFFEMIAGSLNSKEFFRLFIKELCGLMWSPEALFFIIHALSNISKHSFLEEEEIIELKRFVSKAFKTHNKIIRSGVQCELINSVIQLTDEKKVSLENVMLMLSCFSTVESFHKGSKIWNEVIDWLRSAFSKNEAESILQKYKTDNIPSKCNEKSLALMLIMFYCAYGSKNNHVDHFKSNCFVQSRLAEMLFSFKDISRRLYCDKSLYDHYLSIIFHILEESLNCINMYETDLLKLIILSWYDLFSYIKLQQKQISGLNDFYTCQLYVKTFENLLKVQKIFKINSESVVNNFWMDLIDNVEESVKPHSSVPSIRKYFEFHLLRSISKISFENKKPPNFDILYLYLVKGVNEPLVKDSNYSENTKDYQVLWGKMNSEYLETKWQLFELLLDIDNLDNNEKIDNGLSHKDLVKFCKEALSVGGYGVLCPVMAVLKVVLPKLDNGLETKEIINSVWKIIMERRKTDEFKLFIEHFIEMSFQENLFRRGNILKDLLFEYTDVLFLDSSFAVINIFMKHIQKIHISDDLIPLFCHTVGKGLLYGPVQRKDEKLTVQVCSHIEFLNIFPVNGYNTSNEIRARAVQKILSLNKNCLIHQAFAKNLINTLLSLESNTNKNRIRYFGDSFTHRIKHRVMQALLLLEPFIDQKVAEELLAWLYDSLMTENSQPSVKYQQEWLMVRLLLNYKNFLNTFWSYFNDSVSKKAKGLCSLISISYHISKLISHDLIQPWINQAITTVLPFCMDQQFEVRLYAQVVLEKIYNLAKTKNLNDIVQKYEMVNQSVLESIKRGYRGNASKNCAKLQEDFYLNVFNPLEHYSLQTIYMDLPRLANVGPDEWISTKIFKLCGVETKTISILLENTNNSLETVDSATWLVERPHHGVFTEEKFEEINKNFQKKMIPTKPLLPEPDSSFFFGNSDSKIKSLKKDGLIVVASLIDRIPNLGGLARTCEIFGTTEYVLNSLKHVEDKQFASLSVTAEKWITIKEVKSQNLLEYLLEMKRMEYTVIGAEQTLYSQPLSTVKFPKKSLLLLGNEKEGIPPDLLPLLDICIEIPQVGVIRSLNVHVTGALFIWEYAKQHYFF